MQLGALSLDWEEIESDTGSGIKAVVECGALALGSLANAPPARLFVIAN
jgi:hypothetical protein